MLPSHLRDAIDPRENTAAVLSRPALPTATLPQNGIFLDHVDTGTCRGCGNSMHKLKKAVECPCGLRYCVVRLRGRLLICSKQRAAYDELGRYCHCELADLGRCACAACRKRKRRQENNAENAERASQRARHSPEASPEVQCRRVRALAVATGTARIVLLLPSHSWSDFVHTLQVALDIPHVSSITDADGFAFTDTDSVRDNDVLHVHSELPELLPTPPAMVSPGLQLDTEMATESDVLMPKDETIVCPQAEEMDLLLADLMGAPLSAELDLDLAVLLHEQESLHERPPLRPPLQPPLVVGLVYYLVVTYINCTTQQHVVDNNEPRVLSAPILVAAC